MAAATWTKPWQKNRLKNMAATPERHHGRDQKTWPRMWRLRGWS